MSEIQWVKGLVRFDRRYVGENAPRVIVKLLGKDAAPYFVHQVPEELLEALNNTAFMEIRGIEAFGKVQNQNFNWVPGLTKFSPLAAEDLEIQIVEAPVVASEQSTQTEEQVIAEKQAARERRRAAAKADSAVKTGDATAV